MRKLKIITILVFILLVLAMCTLEMMDPYYATDNVPYMSDCIGR